MRQSERELLHYEIRKAYELIHERKAYDEAHEVAQKARAQLAAAGETSAYVEWLIALALDLGGRSYEAAEYIERAHAIDPCEPAYNNSRRVIYQHLRARLLELDANQADDGLPRTYQSLIDRGEADWDCHLHMVRWLGTQGRLGDARRLLEAIVLLYPGCKEAWNRLALVAAAAGDVELRQAAEAGLAGTVAPTSSHGVKASA